MPNYLASLLEVFDSRRVVLSLNQDKWNALIEHWWSVDGRTAKFAVAEERLEIRPKSSQNAFLGYRIVAKRQGSSVIVAETLEGGLFSTFAKVVATSIVGVLPFVIAAAFLRGEGWLSVLKVVGLGVLALVMLYAMVWIAGWLPRLLFGHFRNDLVAKFGGVTR